MGSTSRGTPVLLDTRMGFGCGAQEDRGEEEDVKEAKGEVGAFSKTGSRC